MYLTLTEKGNKFCSACKDNWLQKFQKPQSEFKSGFWNSVSITDTNKLKS